MEGKGKYYKGAKEKGAQTKELAEVSKGNEKKKVSIQNSWGLANGQ